MMVLKNWHLLVIKSQQGGSIAGYKQHLSVKRADERPSTLSCEGCAVSASYVMWRSSPRAGVMSAHTINNAGGGGGGGRIHHPQIK